MTPTEQDKELREEIQNYAIDFHNSYRPNYPTPDLDALMQLITADRERVVLEARIDEINYLDDNFQVDSQDWEREHPGYSTAMIPMEDYIRRHAELKAQQEEV